MTVNAEKIVPRAFVWRRLHSLFGFWLVIYLIEHLLTNSQAALWIGDDGIGFVRFVNLLHGIPYLQVVEVILLGIPIAVHGILGIRYALTAKSNSRKTDGSKPSMRTGRSRAFTWQRITSWVLLIGIILHVIQMRFLDKPEKTMINNQEEYLIKVNLDQGLYDVAARLGVDLYGKNEIASFNRKLEPVQSSNEGLLESAEAIPYSEEEAKEAAQNQTNKEYNEWARSLASFSLSSTEVVAAAKSPGTAILLAVRNTFKNPLMCFLYTVFVLAAAFHAFNGLWTFLISWGAILSFRSQKSMVSVCVLVMVIFLFLGLASIWGSYWINLRN